MRAVVYARVSSAAQRDRHTIASQLRILPEYVAARGWTLVRPATTYVDDGFSAKAGLLAARDAFARLLADTARGIFDVVVVVDQDRISRSEKYGERGAILGAFQDAGVRIAVASTGQLLDLNSDEGDLLAGLGAYFAAAENRKRRDRTIRGKIEALRKGKKPSGPTPYGFVYDRMTGAWSHDPEAAAIVREIFERAASGESCYRLSLELEARGVPRPRSGHWTRSRAWQIVLNPAYRGEWIGDKARRLVVTVPPIVGAELWHRANAMLPANRRTVPRPPRSKRWNLIEGIARCGECGSKIGIIGGGRPRLDGSRPRYYVCERKRGPKAAGERCGNLMRRVEELDAAVWSKMKDEVDRPGLAAEALAARRELAGAPDHAAELAGWERQIAALDRAEAAILERFRRGKVSERAMDLEVAAAARHRALLERNRDLARQELADARHDAADRAALAASLGGLRAAMDAATAEERQRIARILVPGRAGLQVTLWRDRVEVAGRIGGAAAERPVFSASAPGSSGERSENPARLFRLVVAK